MYVYARKQISIGPLTRDAVIEIFLFVHYTILHLFLLSSGISFKVNYRRYDEYCNSYLLCDNSTAMLKCDSKTKLCKCEDNFRIQGDVCGKIDLYYLSI